jgi:hypothetical protein
MTMTYHEQSVLNGLAGRAAIRDLTARHNRFYTGGELAGWIATFRHSGATFIRAGETFTDLRAAFDGGNGQRLVTVDEEISVDGVDATQCCIALLFGRTELLATGTYTDRLIYERGAWYFASRELAWDHLPRNDSLPV